MSGKSTTSTAPTKRTGSKAVRRKPAPVTTTNPLDGLPGALRRLAASTGDVRRWRQVGPSAIELDIEDARALGLL